MQIFSLTSIAQRCQYEVKTSQWQTEFWTRICTRISPPGFKLASRNLYPSPFSHWRSSETYLGDVVDIGEEPLHQNPFKLAGFRIWKSVSQFPDRFGNTSDSRKEDWGCHVRQDTPPFFSAMPRLLETVKRPPVTSRQVVPLLLSLGNYSSWLSKVYQKIYSKGLGFTLANTLTKSFRRLNFFGS